MGTVLITGCAHPGIVKNVAAARAILGSNVYFVVGGFHLGGLGENPPAEIINAFKKLGVTCAGPCHFLGDTARGLFENANDRDHGTIGAGSVISLKRSA